MPSNHLILCCPLLLLPSIFSSIRVFSNDLALQSGGQSIGVSALASYLTPLHKIASCLIYYACNLHLFLVARMYAPKSRSLCQFICWCISGVRNSLSVQFSHSFMCDSLRPHKLQHTRPPCPSSTPGVYPNSCLLSRWCHPTISASVVPFSSCLQSFPASGSFQMSQFFTSGGQSSGTSTSASVLPMNIQDWFPLGWTDWISLQSKGLSRVFSNTTVQKHQLFDAQLSL